MTELIKEAVIREGVWKLISKIYDKILLACILFLAAEGWGQFKKVNSNEELIKQNTQQIIYQAKDIAKGIEDRTLLKNSLDSLLHCLGEKAIRDSANMAEIQKTLRLLLNKNGL